MAAIRGKNTKPELLVRRLLHRLGYRFRLHDRRLPGKPDIVFQARRKVVFVHGCFWHQHEGCRVSHIPKSRIAYWTEKLGRNVDRDASQKRALEQEGWAVRIVWECSVRRPHDLAQELQAFLGEPRFASRSAKAKTEWQRAN
jgi:DNA mismatch endonuclease (patch repair protein)